MRRITFLFTLISMVVSSTTPVAFANQDVTPEKVEKIREMLVTEFNVLSELSNQKWEEFFVSHAQLLEKQGRADRAQAAVSMADPALREEVLALYREKIDSLSENGILLILAALFAADDDGDYYYEDEYYWDREPYWDREYHCEYRHGHQYCEYRQVRKWRNVRRSRRVRRHRSGHGDSDGPVTDVEVALILIILTLNEDMPASEV